MSPSGCLTGARCTADESALAAADLDPALGAIARIDTLRD